MRVAIHQPNLFPWLGFFDKMASSDLFILLDNVPFTKGGFQNRVQLKGPGGPQWLTLPVITRGRLGQITNEVEINNRTHWQKDHLATLEALYRKTPGYTDLMKAFEPLYAGLYERLVDFCTPGVMIIREALKISTPVVKASELGVEGGGSELLAALVAKSGGSVYLSGPSGRHYMDPSMFRSRGVDVEYHEFHPFEYPQRFGEFATGLSALDFLFNAPERGMGE